MFGHIVLLLTVLLSSVQGQNEWRSSFHNSYKCRGTVCHPGYTLDYQTCACAENCPGVVCRIGFYVVQKTCKCLLKKRLSNYIWNKSKPTDVCPIPNCQIDLSRGLCQVYRHDSRGCQTCQCLCYEHDARCPTCHYGAEKYVDDTGCSRCKCKNRPEVTVPSPPNYICPIPNCQSDRELGKCQVYKKNSRGCQTCQCLCYENDVRCPRCRYGTEIYLDNIGCSACRCRSSPDVMAQSTPDDICAAPNCRSDPRRGGCQVFRNDSRGCQTCQCLCYAHDARCPRCRYGTENYVDSRGCTRCKCKSYSEVKVTRAPRHDECPALTCRMSCPHGMAKDENGCFMCKCAEHIACKRQRCWKRCPYGYVNDHNGCPTCTCKYQESVIKPECRQPRCHNHCPHGSVLDHNGCPTCRCKDQEPEKTPACHKPNCRQRCRYGFLQDRNGCQTCQCKRKPERKSDCRLQCRKNCRYGFVKDGNGCPTCTCKSDPRSEPKPRPSTRCRATCRNHCPLGRIYDRNGCPTCSCKKKPSDESKKECPPLCKNYCPFGRVHDDNGCPMCRCLPPSNLESPQPIIDFSSRQEPACSPLRCHRFCSDGYLKDEEGCDTCTCKPRAHSSTKECTPAYTRCQNTCQYGRVLDESGCPTCECISCPEQQCRNYCPYGRIHRNGCPTCICKRLERASVPFTGFITDQLK